MKYSKSMFKKFHNYELSNSQLQEFEEAIKNRKMNLSLENFKFSELISAEIFNPGYIELVNEKREDILKQLPDMSKKGKIFPIKLVIGIAASFFILACMVFLFQNGMSKSQIHKSISQHSLAALNLDHLSTVERSAEQIQSHPIYELYDSGSYALLIKEVNQIEKSEILQLLEARSFMHIGEHREALGILQELDHPKFPQRDALLWSLVETEYLLGNLGNVTNYLNEIISNKYPNYKEAQKILNKM